MPRKAAKSAAGGRPLAELLGSLPCPTGLLCARAGSATDVVAATAMWVSYDPVIVAVYLKPGSTAHRLVNEGRHFTFNVADEAQNAAALKAGSIKGGDAGKLAKVGVTLVPGSVPSPRVAGAAASYDCRVLKVAACGDHDLFLGLVTDWTVRAGGKPVVRFGGASCGVGKALPGPSVSYPH
ncbi:MAG: flavin reductase family protein [Burkholderiales bacterium]|jgi:flavin reductase (DIM6/NTAB) family NADH-FMN oxidoreductase RutF|nr:flavin reductase family protein [Burkholderiales bacterium]